MLTRTHSLQIRLRLEVWRATIAPAEPGDNALDQEDFKIICVPFSSAKIVVDHYVPLCFLAPHT